MTAREPLHVVGAAILAGDRCLVARRGPGMSLPGLWEFPGGKVEPGESDRAALAREIREELGCDVEVGALLFRHAHDYPDLHVDLAFYDCALPEGAEPRPLGVAGVEWAPPGSLGSYAFCPADLAVLPRLGG